MKSYNTLPLPEHDKLKAIQPLSQAVYNFLEWCEHQHIYLGKYDARRDRMEPIYTSREQLLADHFEIDMKKLEREKKAILAEQRELNERLRAKS